MAQITENGWIDITATGSSPDLEPRRPGELVPRPELNPINTAIRALADGNYDGSLVWSISGPPGSGRSGALELLLSEARSAQVQTVSIDLAAAAAQSKSIAPILLEIAQQAGIDTSAWDLESANAAAINTWSAQLVDHLANPHTPPMVVLFDNADDFTLVDMDPPYRGEKRRYGANNLRFDLGNALLNPLIEQTKGEHHSDSLFVFASQRQLDWAKRQDIHDHQTIVPLMPFSKDQIAAQLKGSRLAAHLEMVYAATQGHAGATAYVMDHAEQFLALDEAGQFHMAYDLISARRGIGTDTAGLLEAAALFGHRGQVSDNSSDVSFNIEQIRRLAQQVTYTRGRTYTYTDDGWSSAPHDGVYSPRTPITITDESYPPYGRARYYIYTDQLYAAGLITFTPDRLIHLEPHTSKLLLRKNQIDYPDDFAANQQAAYDILHPTDNS